MRVSWTENLGRLSWALEYVRHGIHLKVTVARFLLPRTQINFAMIFSRLSLLQIKSEKRAAVC